MSSRKAALSPLNLAAWGPGRLRLASTRSSFREDRHLAKTASPESQGGGRGGGGRRRRRRRRRRRGGGGRGHVEMGEE